MKSSLSGTYILLASAIWIRPCWSRYRQRNPWLRFHSGHQVARTHIVSANASCLPESGALRSARASEESVAQSIRDQIILVNLWQLRLSFRLLYFSSLNLRGCFFCRAFRGGERRSEGPIEWDPAKQNQLDWSIKAHVHDLMIKCC